MPSRHGRPGSFVFPSVFLYKTRLNVLAAIAGVVTGASIGYCLLCVFAARRFAGEQQHSTPVLSELPAVSILKPLKGSDPEMYESFRSHCVQDYRGYEILFGVHDQNDPAIALVDRLKREFPDRDIHLAYCEKRLGANGKVSVLAQLAKIAKHEVLVVNDSDIRVAPGYLRTIVSELLKPDVGLVTCLYRGIPARTIGSRLESLGISTDFVPGVLVAQQIEGGLSFGLGSTLTLRRETLAAIGGFEVIADFLGDDYELGKRTTELGLKVKLSTSTVETFLPAYDFSGFLLHQLRWARTIRASRPAGYFGLVLTYTLSWGILCLLLARGALWAWGLLALAVLMRLLVSIVTGVSVTRERRIWRGLWLLPLRDIMAVAVWIGGMWGRKIFWRGEEFILEGGRLRRAGD